MTEPFFYPRYTVYYHNIDLLSSPISYVALVLPFSHISLGDDGNSTINAIRNNHRQHVQAYDFIAPLGKV